MSEFTESQLKKLIDHEVKAMPEERLKARAITALATECLVYRSVLQKIKDIPCGPDRGSAQSQIDLASDLAESVLKPNGTKGSANG